MKLQLHYNRLKAAAAAAAVIMMNRMTVHIAAGAQAAIDYA